MHKYDIKTIQELLLEDMIEFDRICRKYNITYWLCAGTLLGAIRHHGFIPWDDDIDIGMMRSDFNKFTEAFCLENSRFLILQNYDIEYHNHKNMDNTYLNAICNTKLRDTRAIAIENCDLYLKNNYQHIFIDIFIFDEVSELTLTRKALTNTIRCIIADIKFVIKKHKTWCKYQLSKVVLPLIPKRLLWKLSCRLRDFASVSISSQTKHKDFIMLTPDSTITNAIYEKSKIFPVKELSFCGHMFLGPNDYDYYLNKRFGNYMNIPKDITKCGHFLKVEITNEQI